MAGSVPLGLMGLKHAESEHSPLLTPPITQSSIITSRILFVLGLTSVQSLAVLLIAALVRVNVAASVLGVLLIVLTGLLLGVGILSLSMALALPKSVNHPIIPPNLFTAASMTLSSILDFARLNPRTT
jgi:ABC-type Na+ efflux pump permease subunit